MKYLFSQRDYILAVLKANILEALANGFAAYIPAIFMFIQNIIFMSIWVVFFNYADNLYGWTLKEMLLLTGIVAAAFGTTSVLCGGAYILNQNVQSGALDNLLCRPGSVLISAVFSNTRVAGFGDILTGLAICAYVSGTDLSAWFFFVSCLIGVSLLFGSVIVIIQSVGFWRANTVTLSDALFEFVIILASQPQHGFPTLAKVLIFTVVPVGFMGLLPVMVFTSQSLLLLLPLFGAAILFAFIARAVFYKGLEQYKSGNLVGL